MKAQLQKLNGVSLRTSLTLILSSLLVLVKPTAKKIVNTETTTRRLLRKLLSEKSRRMKMLQDIRLLET